MEIFWTFFPIHVKDETKIKLSLHQGQHHDKNLTPPIMLNTPPKGQHGGDSIMLWGRLSVAEIGKLVSWKKVWC